MTEWAIEGANGLVFSQPHAITTPDGTQHPPNVWRLWPDDALAEIGVWRVDRDPVPDGQIATGWTLTRVGNRVRAVPTLAPAPDPRAAWRETASLPKSEFVLRALAAGLLTPADAVAAARGEIPAPMLAALSGLGDEALAVAQITWAAGTIIERMDPAILALAAALGLSDEALDDLFGWSE